jgi:hypothetical protein
MLDETAFSPRTSPLNLYILWEYIPLSVELLLLCLFFLVDSLNTVQLEFFLLIVLI